MGCRSCGCVVPSQCAEIRSALPCVSHEACGRSVQFEECNRVPRFARTCRQSILEYKSISLHAIDKVERRVDILEKRNDLEVVSGGDYEVLRRRDLSQGGFGSCDLLDRIRPTKQFVEKKKVSLVTGSRE